jgi:pimeloyl-ACP methyl ester carboxylesterase
MGFAFLRMSPYPRACHKKAEEIMTKLNQTVVLADGRRLGFDDYGPPDGFPIFYFHGTPSSRKDWPALGNAGLPEKLGVRILSADRPGMGLSSFQPGRRIGDWPADVATLADALGLDRFAVLGYSGGGPYALACALKIPQRLAAAGVAAGEGPADAPGIYSGINPQALNYMNMARQKPFQFRLIWGMVCVIAHYAPRLLVRGGGFFTGLPEADQAAARAHPESSRALLAAMFESVRRGTRGPQWDAALAVSPWDFAIEDISMTVQLWQGEDDRNVSSACGRYLAAKIPHCRAVFLPSEGHISLAINHLEEILRALSGQ